MRKTLARLRHARFRDLVSGLMMGLMVVGCTYFRKPSGPIPTYAAPAPSPTTGGPLVVVLPGRGDDLDDLKKTGIATTIQNAWPQATVLLAGATLPYYTEGRLAERLHQEIIEPARRRGYSQIWLAGASMGGMGVLLYEHDHPGEVTGLLLMAPFMGNPSQVEAVTQAGGPAAWDPGPRPVAVDSDNYQREIWRVVKSWNVDKIRAAQVWLVCGDQDRLLDSAKLIAPLLPVGHFVQGSGGHDWAVWDAGAGQVFARIAAGPRTLVP